MLSVIKLIASIIFCQLAGAIGSISTIQNVNTWYVTLNKPSFNPPSWIFGPVWTLLYTLMGIALWLVWMKGFNSSLSRWALVLFIVQLMLNALWSHLFFGLKVPFWALIELVIMWIVIVVTTVMFYKLSPIAGILMLPYILWVSFASVLNYAIWKLN